MRWIAALLLAACGEAEAVPPPEPVAEAPIPTMASCRRSEGATCMEFGTADIARLGWSGVQQSCGSSSELVPNAPCPSENRVGGCGEPGDSEPNWYYAPRYTLVSAMEACRQMQTLGCPRCTFVPPP